MIREIIESLKRRKVYSILVTFLVSCFLITIFFVVQTLQVYFEKGSMIEPFGDLDVYGLFDTLETDEEYQAFLNESEALERIKKYYTKLNENFDDQYLYVFQQPIEIENIIDEIYLEGYEEGRAEQYINSGSPYPIKTVQLNEQALNMFPLEIKEGEMLTSRDFQYQRNGQIPVLLGSRYKQQFEIGDLIKGSYIFKDFKFMVKGFLKQNSFVERPGFSEINLERSVIMPAIEFDEPKSLEDKKFQLRHYMQLINGAIYTINDRSIVEKQLQDTKEMSGFTHSTILGDSTNALGKYFSALEQHINWLILFAIILFFVSVGGTATFIFKKVKESSKNIIIHLISGGEMRHVSQIIYGELMILIMIPTVIITFIISTIIPNLPLLYPIVIIIAGLMVTIFSVIPLYILIRRTPISQWLKRGGE